MVVRRPSKNENPEAKTPQEERFSRLFYVAAISANRHGFSFYVIGSYTPEAWRARVKEQGCYKSPITNPRTTYKTSHATMGLKSIIPNEGMIRRIGSISQLVRL
jgi:hypothetical protein